MMENNFERNYITEKLWEPILCETLVFYYGCPNITDYINKDRILIIENLEEKNILKLNGYGSRSI
jgi:hypothetical protein